MQLNTALVMTRQLQLSFGLPVRWLLPCGLLPDIAMPVCLSQSISGHNRSGVPSLHMLTQLCVALLQ